MDEELPASRRLRCLYGGAAALFGAAAVGIVASALDAGYAAGSARAFPLFVALLGLSAPLWLGAGMGVAALRAFLADGAAFSARRTRQALLAMDVERRGYVTALAFGGVLGVFVWVVATANLAARLLASELGPPATGAALSAVSLVLAWLLGGLVLGAAVLAAPKLAALRPDRSVALALLALALGLGLAMATGTSSGTGNALAILGVFKRAELDLRGLALVALVALGAASMPRPARGRTAAAATVLALLLLVATVHSAHSGLADRHVALAIERNAPLGKKTLALARSLTDRDRDGRSSRFGGGDCNDRDPNIGPDAIDVPGNGRDEDCSGNDETPPAKRAETATELDQRAQLEKRLPEKPGVVLISIDTLRYDLGYMGYPRAITPNIDALAKKSVVFERAYALASYTGKSLGPMLIGKYAGETERGFSHFNRFPKSELFVQERLKTAGVFTLSVQGYWYFFQNAGFERGFEVIDSSAAPKLAKVEGDQTWNSDKISDAALALLQRPELENRPFFMWIHYVDPHSEYARHEGFDFGASARDRYDGEVSFVDQQVGRVLSAIEQSGLRERTAVIVTSDHGEAFGEHGMIRHGFELWEELIRVPLVVHVPGLDARRIAVRRSAIDLVPTILDLMRAAPPSQQGSDFVTGQSLLFDLFMPEGHVLEQRPIYVDMAAGPHNAERQAYIEGDLKLVVSGTRSLSLFDLAADPGERTDLLDRREIAEPLLQRFRAFRSQLRAVRAPPPR